MKMNKIVNRETYTMKICSLLISMANFNNFLTKVNFIVV